MVGKNVGSFDTYKTKKVIKSYDIKITYKNGFINLLSFDYPYIFDYIKTNNHYS